jgi:hypothetical protein
MKSLSYDYTADKMLHLFEDLVRGIDNMTKDKFSEMYEKVLEDAAAIHKNEMRIAWEASREMSDTEFDEWYYNHFVEPPVEEESSNKEK